MPSDDGHPGYDCGGTCVLHSGLAMVVNPVPATPAEVSGGEAEFRFALEGMVAAFDTWYPDESVAKTTRACAMSIAKQALGWPTSPLKTSDIIENRP